MPIAARCGDGEAEYRCVRRFRHRRLLTMLWLQGFKATAESMLCKSDAVFSVLRLRQLVEIGRWRDAIHYLSRFLPPPGARWPPSVEAVVLRLFLVVHWRLAAMVAGEKESPVCTQYLSHGRAVCHGAIRLRSILLNVLHTRQQLRVSMDWERVRLKAAEIVQNLGQRTPELKDLMYMPSGPMKPHNVVPIGFGFRRRYPLKKQASRPSASALAKHHLLKTRRLPAISGPSQESCPELLNSKALDWVADIVDECLKAGTHPKSHQLHPLQTSGMEGATVAPPASQTMFGSWARPTVDRSMLPMENGVKLTNLLLRMSAALVVHLFWYFRQPLLETRFLISTHAGKLASHVTAPGAHFLGTVGAPFSGNKTSHREISGTTFLANAGAPVPPVSQIMNLKSHAGDSDVAPVLQNLSCSAETDQTPLVANAATMLDAPVPLTAVGCLTSTTKISGQSPMANSAGAPVVPAMQTMNLSTHAESSAINKCFDKEGRKNESARQRLNPREELSILEEQDLHLKKQRTTGTFGEASLTKAIET